MFVGDQSSSELKLLVTKPSIMSILTTDYALITGIRFILNGTAGILFYYLFYYISIYIDITKVSNSQHKR